MNLDLPVTLTVARALFRQLSGFRGYPKPGSGEDYFIQAFQEAVVSVEHAMAVVAAFTHTMPTIQDIRDSAFNLRPKFEPKVDQTAEWEAKYGKPDTSWGSKLLGNHERAIGAVHWQAIRDSLYYTEGPGRGKPSGFWLEAMERHLTTRPNEVAALRAEIAQYGWEALMEFDWAKSIDTRSKKDMLAKPPEIVKQITQADVGRVLAEERARNAR